MQLGVPMQERERFLWDSKQEMHAIFVGNDRSIDAIGPSPTWRPTDTEYDVPN